MFCGKQEFVYNSEKDLSQCPCGAITRKVVIEPTPTHTIGNQEYFGIRKKMKKYKYKCSCGGIFQLDHDKSCSDRITIKCSKNCGVSKTYYPLGCPGKDYVRDRRGGFRMLGVYDG